MDVSDLKGVFGEVKKRMDGQIEHVRRELGGVRTGRASVNILDAVHVEAYGSPMPVNQVASLSIPEPTLIVAQPFDPSLLGAVERAIRSANLGLNPTNDGKVVRIPLPALTEERRKELSKLAHQYAEKAKIAVRNVRGDGRDALKADENKKEISQDEHKRLDAEVQKLTDDTVKEIDDVLAAKDREILQK